MTRSVTIWAGFLLTIASCTFTRQVRTGMQAYEVKQYALAATLFQEEYGSVRTPEVKAQLAFLLGETYSVLNNHTQAARWYDTADKDGYGDNAKIQLARSLVRLEKYETALGIYQDLQRRNPAIAAYRSAVTTCRQAMEWAAQPRDDVSVKPVAWNSPAADYLAIPIARDQILFTSDRGDDQNPGETYWWTGRSFADIYTYSTVTGKVTPYVPAVNTPKNEGTGLMSPDGEWLVFTRCSADNTYDAWCNLMISQRRGNQWSEPRPLPFQQEKVNYGHPAFAAGGNTLFFSSDMPGGQGGHDLYFTQPDGQGNWSPPINLGPRINTVGNEQFPTVYLDTLYFSSDHLAGLGGLDIFKTYLDAQESWIPPVNLGAPFNSGGDDFGFVVDTFTPLPEGVLLRGFLTSSRGGVDRGDDIFAVEVMGRVPDVIAAAPADPEVPPPAEEPLPQLFLAIRVLAPEYEIRDDPNSRILNRRPLPNGPVIMSKGVADERFVTDGLGQLLLKLEWGTSYTFTARYRDHLTATYEVNTAAILPDADKSIMTINHTFVLDPIFRDKEIVLENIFYDYDQWYIREDAKPSLNQLATILKNNPQIRILLSSYTDCRGTEDYNMELSRKRAQAAVDYLASVGIPVRRLESRGLGESSPVVLCECERCTEEEHQANRRTTFKIID